MCSIMPSNGYNCLICQTMLGLKDHFHWFLVAVVQNYISVLLHICTFALLAVVSSNIGYL